MTKVADSSTKTWGERAAEDTSLRAFVDAEIARAHVELQSLRVEVEHLHAVIATKQREVEALKLELKSKKTAGRTTDKPSERLAG